MREYCCAKLKWAILKGEIIPPANPVFECDCHTHSNTWNQIIGRYSNDTEIGRTISFCPYCYAKLPEYSIFQP